MFLYYGIAIDNTILLVINDISTTHPYPTQNILQIIQVLLDYLNIYTLVQEKVQNLRHTITSTNNTESMISGYFYWSRSKSTEPLLKPFLTTAIHEKYKLLRHIVTSVEEAEIANLFYDCQIAIDICKILSVHGYA